MRHWLRFFPALVALFLSACGDDATAPDPPFAFEDLGTPVAVRESVAFLEGPAWSQDEGVLYYTDLSTSRTFRFSPPAFFSRVEVDVVQANGLAFDGEGRLLLADQGGRRLVRREANGQLTVLADRYAGQKLNSPNDIAIRSDGTIYFTDPDFGFSVPELAFQGIYRRATDGRLVRESDDDGAPNGVILTPDESRLYVAMTFGARVDVYDVASDGSLSSRRVFTDQNVLIPDGMCVDAQGTLFVGSVGGLNVFSPTGAHLGTVELDTAASNCGFGGEDGRTIFATAGGTLYRISTPVRGAAFGSR